MPFETVRLSPLPDATAPDGSEVRVLCRVSRGSLAHFTLPPDAVSRAMVHRTVDEVWYTIPVGTYFQFRAASSEPLTAVGTTIPPWPGESEAFAVDGIWEPTV